MYFWLLLQILSGSVIKLVIDFGQLMPGEKTGVNMDVTFLVSSQYCAHIICNLRMCSFPQIGFEPFTERMEVHSEAGENNEVK